MARFKKASIPVAVRREVCLRYGPKGDHVDAHCHFCGAVGAIQWFYVERGLPGWPAIQDLELDHLEPEFSGGPTVASNIVLSCKRCNCSRGYRRAVPRHLEAA